MARSVCHPVLDICLSRTGVQRALQKVDSEHVSHIGTDVMLFSRFRISLTQILISFALHRYEGNKHGLHGYSVLFLAFVVSAVDFMALVGRAVSYIRSVRSGQEHFTFKSCWNTIVLDREEHVSGTSAEYSTLVHEEPDDYDAAELKAREIEEAESSDPIHVRRARAMVPIDTELAQDEHHATAQWANNVYPQSVASERTLFGRANSPRGSMHSDETLHEGLWKNVNRTSLLKRVGCIAFGTSERVLVFAGLMQFLTGIVDYTGGCRQNWVNGCLAHLISE